MVKKDSKTPERDIYDTLLDDMGTEEGIPFEALLRPHAWEKQGNQWRRKPRRNKYDQLLDQMSADYAHEGAQHYKWNEKKGQWRRKEEK